MVICKSEDVCTSEMFYNRYVCSVYLFIGNPQALGSDDSALISSGTASTVGIALGVIVTVTNLVILGFLVYRYGRSLRHKRKNKKTSLNEHGHTNMAFRAEAGTAKSFNSLSSKFNSGVTDMETISSSSSVNTVS